MEIMDLGQDTFLVGRRVIKAGEPGMFDLEKQEDRDELIRLAEGLFKSKFDKPCYGELTVYVPHQVPKDLAQKYKMPTDAKYIDGQMHFSHLHDSAKEILRKEFPDYAGKI